MTDSHRSWIEADWPVAAHVRAGTTLRRGGVSEGNYASLNLASHVGDQQTAVAENRARIIKQLGLPTMPSWMTQVHGTTIVDVDSALPESIQADGSLTRQRHTISAVLTADCVPLLITDKDGSCVAAIHAGWRGLCAGIIDRAISKVGDPSELFVWIGPCISKDYYEVGSDVVLACNSYHDRSHLALERRDETHWLLDLNQLVKLILAKLGVHQVFDSALCTYRQSDFFYSYRREGITGRTASMIWME